MTAGSWSAALDPERVNDMRLLIALHPANSEPRATGKRAHLALARTLADMSDLPEAAITAILAAAGAASNLLEDGQTHSLSDALERTLEAPLVPEHVQAILAGATLRSHETLNHMERTGTDPDGYHPAQIDQQRRVAAMTLGAFRTWELLMDRTPGHETAAAPAVPDPDAVLKAGRGDAAPIPPTATPGAGPTGDAEDP